MLGELTKRIHNIIVSNVVSGKIQVKRTRVLLGEFRDDFFQHAHVGKLRFSAPCLGSGYFGRRGGGRGGRSGVLTHLHTMHLMETQKNLKFFPTIC